MPLLVFKTFCCFCRTLPPLGVIESILIKLLLHHSTSDHFTTRSVFHSNLQNIMFLKVSGPTHHDDLYSKESACSASKKSIFTFFISNFALKNTQYQKMAYFVKQSQKAPFYQICCAVTQCYWSLESSSSTQGGVNIAAAVTPIAFLKVRFLYCVTPPPLPQLFAHLSHFLVEMLQNKPKVED